jgi:hypothetical protein
MKLRYKDENGKDHEMHIKYFSSEMFKILTWQMVAYFIVWLSLLAIFTIILIIASFFGA